MEEEKEVSSFRRVYGARLALLLTALCAIAASLRWVLLRESVGGVDLYFYLTSARDVVLDQATAPFGRYGYFPGVYVFWGRVIRSFGHSFSAVQWVVVSTLLLNAVLVGVALRRVRHGWNYAFAAGFFYLTFSYHLEGLMGATEPIVTVGFLLGLVAFLFLRSSGARTAGAVALGVGFGLAVFSKQQGLLLCVGLTGLVIAPPIVSELRAKLREALLAFIIVCLVLGVCFFLEGGGYRAFRFGVTFAQSYVPQDAFLSNIGWVIKLQPFSTCVLVFALVWIGAFFSRRLFELLTREEWLLGSVALFSLLGSLVQFQRRAYLHYALLGLPSFVMLLMLGAVCFMRLGRRSQWISAALLLLLGWNTHASSGFIFQEFLSGGSESSHALYAEPFQEFCPCLRDREELFLVPPRQNLVHWYCATRSHIWPRGYGWGDVVERSDYFTVIEHEALDAVLLLRREFETNGRLREVFGTLATFGEELKARGYVAVFENGAGILYRHSRDLDVECHLPERNGV